MPTPVHTVMWFRRDLRLADNPALLEACDSDGVLPLFVVDPALWRPAGLPRRAHLAASLRALVASLGARGAALAVLEGDPVEVVPAVARAVGASRVHVAADFGPYGARRDAAVDQALAADRIELVRTGSPYAVAPGTLRTGAGTPYQVFTPFARAWADHGWPGPMPAPETVRGLGVGGTVPVPRVEPPAGMVLPEAGEDAARRRWEEFRATGLEEYAEGRDRPDLDGTSRLSVHLKWGEIHPRTLLADLPPGESTAKFRGELAWREFHADVLHHRPHTAREHLRGRFAAMEYDDPGPAFSAWAEGRTGFPFVDAGMRQLRATGWMHNRLRMVTASFLVKDLHVSWQHGARHFLRWLVDGDLASNNHGWQWVAGSGTDAAPYFRVLNPTTQGRRLDPHGAYVRRWVPELADVRDPHEPGDVAGYARPIVDHAAERREALHRLERLDR